MAAVAWPSGAAACLTEWAATDKVIQKRSQYVVRLLLRTGEKLAKARTNTHILAYDSTQSMRNFNSIQYTKRRTATTAANDDAQSFHTIHSHTLSDGLRKFDTA